MSKKITQGFTLIEVIIYLALFSILMAGSLSAAFALCESGGHERTRAFLLQEGNFIIAKTEWELSGAELISNPTIGSSGTTLSFESVSGYDSAGAPIIDAVVFDPATLVGGRVSIASVHFYHADDTDASPESVGMSFTLAMPTERGALISQNFFSTTTLNQ
ncbi:MAG TPA: prepilin-type N-terminal cleavage/methylation domain-containing protein [Candidatus Paceibacterota bacterium]|nr:prepilin-type N-terminal cleavage/methylation domain-containing protein [Candidatus Paceibacterota bacterium]